MFGQIFISLVPGSMELAFLIVFGRGSVWERVLSSRYWLIQKLIHPEFLSEFDNECMMESVSVIDVWERFPETQWSEFS